MRKVKLTTEQEFELCKTKTLLPYIDRADLENQYMVMCERYIRLHNQVKNII
jgi:hypothetical protein